MLIPAAYLASAAIGTGAGIASDVVEAQSTFTKTDKERLARLQRMTELDQFLTDEERRQYFAGLGTAERELAQRGASDVSAFDVGGGFFARQQLAREGQAMEARGKAATEVRAAEAQARTEAEADILELEDLKAKEKTDTMAAILGGVATGAETVAGLSMRQAEERAAQDVINQTAQQAETADETDDWLDLVAGYG